MTTTSDIAASIPPAGARPAQRGVACTIRALVPDETAVRAAIATLEQHLGPLPQLDVIEPADGEVPPAGEAPTHGTDAATFEVRVVVHDLPPAVWEALASALPAAVLAPAWYPALVEAEDTGALVFDDLVAPEVTARCRVDAESGGVVRLERVRTKAPDDEPDLAALAAALVAGVREVDPGIAVRSDRGADTVQPFVHPHTGRYGIELFVDGVEREDLGGDVVAQRRRDVAAAIGRVIEAWADHPRLPLSSEVAWESALGLRFLLFALGPPAEARPRGADLDDGAAAASVDAWLPAWSTLFDRVEVQVVTAPGDHDRAVLAIAALAESESTAIAVPLAGARPRWVWHAGRPAFAACWDAPVMAGLDDALTAICAVPGVLAARAVPAGPYGFGDWALADAAWWPLADGFALRIHSGRTDRDVLPMVAPREPDLRDGAAMDALIAACAHLPEDAGGLRTVVDGAGRSGLELMLPRACWQEDVLVRWLAAIGGALNPADSTHVWFVGWRGEQPYAYAFWPHTPDAPPPWG